MIRAAALAALVAAVFAGPASAQDEQSLRGVWQGTVGDQSVHACFGGSGDERGVYYYDRYRELIRLQPVENSAGAFVEALGWSDPGDASWQVDSMDQDSATGIWRDADSNAPIMLTRLEWTGRDEYSGPCESSAFMQPRLAGGSIVGEAGELAGQEYVTLTFVPPVQWQAGEGDDAHDVQISSFLLGDDEGDPRRTNRAINGLLSAHLPRGDMSDTYAQCMAQSIGVHGVDGDFMQELVPELITSRWVGALESNSVYCGGAHPSHWQNRRVFDRNSGREIEPSRWLNDVALNRELQEAGKDSHVSATATQALVTALVAQWPAGNEGGDDCAAIAGETAYWDIGLRREGLAFIPSVPHVYTPCADTTVLSWADAAPFLSLEGRAVMLSLAR